MVENTRGLTRRQWLRGASLGVLGPWEATLTHSHAEASGLHGQALIACGWDDTGGAWIGRWPWQEGQLADAPAQHLTLPDRAHGLYGLPDGSVLVLARRPGEWLLRWYPLQPEQTRWQGVSGHTVLAGHAVVHGDSLWTTELEPRSGAGHIVQRQLHDLAPVARWPSGGLDPHMLHRSPTGQWWVLHGGVPRPPYPGAPEHRGEVVSDLSLFDSLDPDALTPPEPQRWRLADPHLSMRHLAWDRASHTLGIALQAHHPDAASRHAAPLLALWRDQQLTLAPQPHALGGYAGDIAATPSGFMLGASRATSPLAPLGQRGVIAHWQADGQWQGAHAWPDACAVAWWPAQDRAVALGVPSHSDPLFDHMHYLSPSSPALSARESDRSLATQTRHWDNHLTWDGG